MPFRIPAPTALARMLALAVMAIGASLPAHAGSANEPRGGVGLSIGTDLVVTNLDRARGYTEGKEHIEDETEIKIAAFVGLNAPPTPPPPGPAHH